MKTKFLSALSVVAISLIATAPLSHATAYTASQFNAMLKTKVGTKTGAAAYNAAASFYKSALGDKKNKKLVVTYTNDVIKILKKPVAIPLTGKSRSTLVNALVNGYFKGLAYNAMDSKYVSALKKLAGGLPGSQQTPAVAQLIAQPALTFNTKKGGSAADVNFINTTIYTAAKQVPPPPVS